MEELKHQSIEEVTNEEFIAKANNYSPVESSSTIKKKSLLKMKKMLVPKKGSKSKSQEKQVNSQEFGKSGCRKRRTRVEDLYYTNDARVSVMEHLEVVLKELGDECRSIYAPVECVSWILADCSKTVF